MMSPVLDWLSEAPLWLVGAIFLLATSLAGFLGHLLRRRGQGSGLAEGEGQEGYIVSGVLGLLALLLGFTLAMAVDRFDVRRGRVLEEANAISTAYLRAQLLAEPHRGRISKLLVEYTDNRIALATADPKDIPPLLARNEQMIISLWAATGPAFESVSNLDFSSTFVEAMNNVTESDAARKAARRAHVPTAVFGILLIYIVVTAGVLGYVLVGSRSYLSGGLVMVLLTLSLLLIMDLDRPTMGGIRVSQEPMEQLRETLKVWQAQLR
jgi:hypothetical protein